MTVSAARRRRLPLLAAAPALATLALAAAAPADAQALAFTVTNDAEQPVPADGALLRTMNTDFAIGYAPGEATRYSATFAGPDGIAVASPISCFSFGTTRNIDFRGNGAYTVTVQQYAENDRQCASPQGAARTVTFQIQSVVGIAPLSGPVLIREPGSFVTRPVTLSVDRNPGALSHEVRYAAGAVIGPDGGISGPTQEAFVDNTTSTTQLRLTTPGLYTVVARAKGFTTSTGQFFSPWSVPVQVRAFAPFDLQTLRFTDSRGPSYRIAGQVRETTARGKVRISLRKGNKGRFRTIGNVKLRRGAKFSKRFTLKRRGRYQLRVSFKGSATTAPGFQTNSIRISRRFLFR